MLLSTENSHLDVVLCRSVAPLTRIVWVQKPKYSEYMKDWKKSVENP